jgi:hypothetical protein
MKEAFRQLANALDAVLFATDRLGFVPEAWQAEVLRSYAPRLGLNCYRQSGKSTVAAIRAVHLAIFRPNATILLVAPSLRQSTELFRKIDYFLKRLGSTVSRIEDNTTSIALANRSRIIVAPASGEGATSRGFSSVDLLVIDEASRVSDDAISSLWPMVSRGGRLMLISTPAGQRGLFYKVFSELGDTWETRTIPVDRVSKPPDKSFLEAAKRANGVRWFEQEYLCLFTATDAALFSFEDLKGCLDINLRPLFGSCDSANFKADSVTLIDARIPPLFTRY